MRKEILKTEIIEEDIKIEESLRPRTLNDYIGQQKVRETMKVYIDAAKNRGETLDHVLLYGPPGLGKTTMAGIIANELGTRLKVISGPAIENRAEMLAILMSLSEGDVLFIDEIHRLSKEIEEFIYSAMEDFEVDALRGKDETSMLKHFKLKHFTLVGATTRAGMLTAPLRDRFGIVFRLEFYTPFELGQIITRSAKVLGIEIDENGAAELARRSRGTPRLANRLLKRVRDFAEVKGDGVITKDITDKTLHLLDVDEAGLDSSDRKVLETIIKNFGGGPVGGESLATSIGEDVGTLEDVIEPYLIQEGYMARTQRGRIATEKAYAHLGLLSL